VRIVAQRDEGNLLLLADDDEVLGRVWRRDTSELFPRHSLSAILKFGWHPPALAL
jgi:hypothetical protein